MAVTVYLHNIPAANTISPIAFASAVTASSASPSVTVPSPAVAVTATSSAHRSAATRQGVSHLDPPSTVVTSVAGVLPDRQPDLHLAVGHEAAPAALLAAALIHSFETKSTN